MFKKKFMILILAGLGVVSFVAAYFVAGMLGVGRSAPPPAPLAAEEEAEGTGAARPPVEMRPSEKLLQTLIRDLRAKIDEVEARARTLDQRERRLRLAEAELRKVTQEVDDLRMSAVAAFAPLNERLKEIQQSLILVSATERANLKRVAAVYDKMTADASSRIFTEMVKSKRVDDAVKLLSYMQERSAAKLLAAISDPAMAAELSDRLKRVKEEG